MTIYRHPKTPNYSKSTRIINKFESPEFGQPAVVNWLGWVAWLAGWLDWPGWLADVYPRCDDYRSLPSPALCFPDFPDSGHPPSPIGVFPPPESRKSGERLPRRGAKQHAKRNTQQPMA